MKLKLENGYTIIKPFEIDLPDLTILTGINGSGKTQILNGIARELIKTDLEGGIIFVSHNSLTNSETYAIASLTNYLSPHEMHLIYQGYLAGHDEGNNHYAYEDRDWIFQKISSVIKKDKRSLNSNDISTNWPIEDDLYDRGRFYQNFHKIFFRYLKKLSENDFNSFLSERYPEKGITSLSKDSFIELYGEAPWDYANIILKNYGSNYRFKDPGRFDFDLKYEDKFYIKMYNILSEAEVEFDHLSNGEKTIMSLFFQLYNSSLDYVKPSLMLMDEVDASLHPLLIKQFLNIIKEVFIKTKHIKVILTTHSPTTVALADDESIYTVCTPGSPDDMIKKTTKDAALKLLTEGIPSFSVNYENRRQVFVESENDVAFYETLYHIFSKYLVGDVSLAFISSGESRTDKHGSKISNCAQVINITNKLYEFGNKFVYGIIDYDEGNIGNEYIKVLGEGKRYAIENYLLDPILLATFLLIEQLLTPDQIGLEPDENYTNISTFENSKLQMITNNILDRIKPYVAIDNEKVIICDLINGREIELPEWYLKHNGHKLEEILKEKVFPGLNAFKKEEKTLKISIIKKVIGIFPGLASVDLIQILKNVQS